jgi:hypothetical protein
MGANLERANDIAECNLHNQSNAAALCFSGHQDALDFASHGIEKRNRMVSTNALLGLVERYREGGCPSFC